MIVIILFNSETTFACPNSLRCARALPESSSIDIWSQNLRLPSAAHCAGPSCSTLSADQEGHGFRMGQDARRTIIEMPAAKRQPRDGPARRQRTGESGLLARVGFTSGLAGSWLSPRRGCLWRENLVLARGGECGDVGPQRPNGCLPSRLFFFPHEIRPLLCLKMWLGHRWRRPKGRNRSDV